MRTRHRPRTEPVDVIKDGSVIDGHILEVSVVDGRILDVSLIDGRILDVSLFYGRFARGRGGRRDAVPVQIFFVIV